MGMFDFLAVTKAVRGAAEQIRNLRAETERLRRQRDELSTAPAARADVKAEFTRYAQSRAADFNAALQKAAAAVASPATFGKLGDGNATRDANLFGLADRAGGLYPVDGLLAAMAPELVAPMIARAVDSAPWPGREGLPRAERAAAVAELDRKIAQLLQQERELVAEARTAGILLPEA